MIDCLLSALVTHTLSLSLSLTLFITHFPPPSSFLVKVITTFSNIRDKFENTGQFPTLFILSGAAGSGKTALVEALLNELCACIGVDKKTSSDFILQVRQHLILLYFQLVMRQSLFLASRWTVR